MRIAIDILHPAHVHFFKNFIVCMRERGHEFVVTARRKDGATDLLRQLAIPFLEISQSSRGPLRQAGEYVARSWRFTRLMRGFRPHVLTGIMGPTIALAGRALGRPAYVFYDTEFAKTTNCFVYPLSTKVITPDCYQASVGPNHIPYCGYHELAYLHPNHFRPDSSVVERCGIDPRQPYSVVRFVGWWATHDRREKGLTADCKMQVVKSLEAYGPVVVSSENEVPPELRRNLYRGPIEQIHHLLAFASLYYGESATMASEAAVLSTPSIYIAKTGRGYTDDQARYGLVHNFLDTQFSDSLAKACKLLSDWPTSGRQAEVAQRRLLHDKIDVTRFMVDLFERDFATAI